MKGGDVRGEQWVESRGRGGEEKKNKKGLLGPDVERGVKKRVLCAALLIWL